MISNEELQYLEARFSVLIVPMPLDKTHSAFVVVKCVTCGHRFWLHETSTANAHNIGGISAHAPICDAEERYLSTREETRLVP